MAEFDNNDYYAYGQSDNTNTYTEENVYYRPYEEPPKPKKEKKHNGFWRKLAKCMALGLVFGLVAGTAFAGTNHFFGKVTGWNQTTEVDEEVLSGADLNISNDTETSGENITADTKSTEVMGSTGAVTDVSTIVDEVMPSIVSITTIARTQVPNFFFGGFCNR